MHQATLFILLMYMVGSVQHNVSGTYIWFLPCYLPFIRTEWQITQTLASFLSIYSSLHFRLQQAAQKTLSKIGKIYSVTQHSFITTSFQIEFCTYIANTHQCCFILILQEKCQNDPPPKKKQQPKTTLVQYSCLVMSYGIYIDQTEYNIMGYNKTRGTHYSHYLIMLKTGNV